MKVKIRHADSPTKKVAIDNINVGDLVPVIGDFLSGKERPQGGSYVYLVTARRFDLGSREVIIFVREIGDLIPDDEWKEE